MRIRRCAGSLWLSRRESSVLLCMRCVALKTFSRLINYSPIFTYGDRGTTKSGVVASEHAIAYSHGYAPTLLVGESGIMKAPICVVMTENERPLSTSSRIYFGIHHPIQYNVKVKDLGNVHPSHIPNLKGYWAMENGETNQDAEVTAAARQGEGG